MNRRTLLKTIAATGIGSPALHGALAAMSQDDGLTLEQIQKAEWITGVPLTDEQREKILDAVRRNQQQLKSARQVPLDYTTSPALHFRPIATPQSDQKLTRNAIPGEWTIGPRPALEEDIAFMPVTELSGLIRTRQITSVDLTRIYLERLKKYGPMLRCVVTLTEDLAMEQARRADQEIRNGMYRGPLHGIPWGAKDLVSYPGYPTTWGVPHFKDRVLNEKATVAARLEQAGAILVAKLSMGALAMGDQWFGGKTRNPWDARTGSSGSSAGSASATAAGLVGFSIGSETLGSITTPSKLCGATGFRPTFGRVSRFGCMPLSWSMDKIGPICRSVEDCALVFDAIHGADGADPTAADHAFDWPSQHNVRGMKVGYHDLRRGNDDRQELEILKNLGCELVKLEPPSLDKVRPLTQIIDIEGACMFDDLLRAGHTDGWNAWTEIFRAAQFVSAIDYVRLLRIRTQVMREFEDYIRGVDALVNVMEIYHTNLAGHPSIVLPRSFREVNGARRPVPVTLTGHLFDDERLLQLAHAFQGACDAHLERPPLDHWKSQFDNGTLDRQPEEEPKPEAEGQSDNSAESDGSNKPAAPDDKRDSQSEKQQGDGL